VIVKELNKASGVWNLKSQFSAQKSGTWPSPQVSFDVDYLVVAGGSGGTGAGGYRTSFPGGTKLTLTGFGPLSVPVTIGAGAGGQGNPSIFSTITSAGGGATFQPGGSGGGGGEGNPAGSGNSPPVSPPQGNPGGAGTPSSYGGGGGAGAAGGAATPGAGGVGGVGLENSITNSPVFYAGGGGGAGSSSGAAGGNGGGGAGAPGGGTSGTVNTGGGGGNSWFTGSPQGGSGIVVVRTPSARTLGASPGTNTVTTLPAPAGGCKVATFTVSGSLTIS
jgi:hypothetical protein